jgi:hypothetical protein
LTHAFSQLSEISVPIFDVKLESFITERFPTICDALNKWWRSHNQGEGDEEATDDSHVYLRIVYRMILILCAHRYYSETLPTNSCVGLAPYIPRNITGSRDFTDIIRQLSEWVETNYDTVMNFANETNIDVSTEIEINLRTFQYLANLCAPGYFFRVTPIKEHGSRVRLRNEVFYSLYQLIPGLELNVKLCSYILDIEKVLKAVYDINPEEESDVSNPIATSNRLMAAITCFESLYDKSHGNCARFVSEYRKFHEYWNWEEPKIQWTFLLCEEHSTGQDFLAYFNGKIALLYDVVAKIPAEGSWVDYKLALSLLEELDNIT